jgi:hypothetical protein
MKINFQSIKVDHGYGEYERTRGIDYTEAVRLAKRARCRDAGAVLPGRLGQTRIRMEGDAVAIRFHRTDVVTFHRSGWMELDNGNWFSKSTKERLETYTGLSVACAGLGGRRWIVSAPSNYYWTEQRGKFWVFKPGMRVRHVKGGKIEVKGAGPALTGAQISEMLREERNERARVRRAERKEQAALDAARAAERSESPPDDDESEHPVETEQVGAAGQPLMTAERIRTIVLSRKPEENRSLFHSVQGGRS